MFASQTEKKVSYSKEYDSITTLCECCYRRRRRQVDMVPVDLFITVTTIEALCTGDATHTESLVGKMKLFRFSTTDKRLFSLALYGDPSSKTHRAFVIIFRYRT